MIGLCTALVNPRDAPSMLGSAQQAANTRQRMTQSFEQAYQVRNLFFLFDALFVVFTALTHGNA
jgi:hypothetical protein